MGFSLLLLTMILIPAVIADSLGPSFYTIASIFTNVYVCVSVIFEFFDIAFLFSDVFFWDSFTVFSMRVI